MLFAEMALHQECSIEGTGEKCVKDIAKVLNFFLLLILS